MILVDTPGESTANREPVNTYALLWPENREKRRAWLLGNYEDALRQSEWLDDDALPHFHTITGTEIFAEAFGCAVHRPEDNMPFALPFVKSWRDAEKVNKPALFDTPLAAQFDLFDALRRAAGPDALLRLPDIQSPMDITALIWDKSDLFTAMLDAPEAVLTLCRKVEELLAEFLGEWFSRYGAKYIAHFPHYYMEGGVTLSEDEIGSVSPELYGVFFGRELAALSERFGGIGIHCCANSKHQWEHLAGVPGLQLINLHLPYKHQLEAMARFGGVCAQWPVFTSGIESREHYLSVMDSLPAGSRVVVHTSASGREDAQTLCADLRGRYG